MDANEKPRPPRRRWFRFGMFTLLMAFSCVAGFFSGYSSGFKWGADDRAQQLRDTVIVARVYNVADLVTPPTDDPDPPPLSETDFEELTQLITSTINHQAWAVNGSGSGEIQPFPTNGSLVISCTGTTHDEISELLEQLRRMQNKLPADLLDRVREAAHRKRSGNVPLKVFTTVTNKLHQKLVDQFEAAVEQLAKEFGQPAGIYQAGDASFPDWATAQQIAVWNHSTGKLYFALQDCQPEGEALVAGWWQESFGAMQPLKLKLDALAKVE